MSIVTIAFNEIARLFMSKRGWFSIFAFALIWFIVLAYVISPAASYLSSPDTGGLIGLLAERIGFSTLRQWESIEIALYWLFTVFQLPFFTMVTAADQIASDRTRGTLRFLVLRASRTQIFFGRFIGQYIIQLLLILVTLGSVLILVAIKSPDSLPIALHEAPIVVTNLAIILLPYVALMSLVSILASSAKQATLFAIVGWIILWLLIGYVQSKFGPIPLLDWVLPGSQLTSLIKLGGWDTLSLAPIPLIHTAVLLILGWVAIQRCDL